MYIYIYIYMQAAKGYGLKLKKGKKLSDTTMLSVFSGVPQSKELVDAVLARSRAQPSICGMAVKDSIKVFACVPDVLAHATTDSESDQLVMCNVAPSHDLVRREHALHVAAAPRQHHFAAGEEQHRAARPMNADGDRGKLLLVVHAV